MINTSERIQNIVSATIFTIKANSEDDLSLVEIEKQSKKFIASFHNLEDIEREEILRQVRKNFEFTLGEGEILKGKDEHQSWFYSRKSDIDFFYWERYRKFLIQGGYGAKVVKTISTINDKVMDLLGDPNADYAFARRGLVIGDVQSGKTSNYISLITKAADAGYKVIFLLTGMVNNLRKQTQERIDLGFLGFDTRQNQNLMKRNSLIGVGRISSKNRTPITMTTSDRDFDRRFANQQFSNFDSRTEPFIFVIKKNTSVLKNIHSWIERHHFKNDLDKLPMIMIDDEADQASINTKKDSEDPTTINMRIRKILSLFSKHSYVGFTATPFANIFIDPDTDDEMLKGDLFPKDFIYVLDSPTNYVGPDKLFLDNGECNYMINEINDMHYHLPLSHKKHDRLINLPDSLKEAILLFMISNAIRDIRGQIDTHRSMLVNISRFRDLQDSAAEIIDDFVINVQRTTKFYPYDKFKDKEIYSDFKNVYEKNYKEIIKGDIGEDRIFKQIGHSVQPIIVTSVNMNHKAEEVLNYKKHKKNGLRVIAVGGQILSRGLTLEGLTISYFYRNSKYYDTLMQMGRWFGYRDGYADLCKVYMEENSIDWYKFIAEASNDLKDEIKAMIKHNLTPNDFGLKVKNHSASLYISAPNKLRNSHTFIKNISLSGEVIETPRLYNDDIIIKKNQESTDLFLGEINRYMISIESNKPFYSGVSKDFIIRFLDNFTPHKSCLHFQTESIINLLKKPESSELNIWDVVVIEGSIDVENTILRSIAKKSIKLVKRNYRVKDNKIIQVSGERNRLGGPADTKFGLSDEDIKKAERLFDENRPSRKKHGGYSAKTYTELKERKPLLMIYPIKLDNSGVKSKKKIVTNELDGKICIGLGLAFPKFEDTKDKYIQYKLNSRAYKEIFFDEDYDFE